MSTSPANMIDAIFDAHGDWLPEDYPFALWDALLRQLPELAGDERIAVLPLRAATGDNGILLTRRAKLTLRLPEDLAPRLSALSERSYDLGSATLALGGLKLRPLQPHPTLHAALVASPLEESAFMQMAQESFAQLDIHARLLCGKRGVLQGAGQTLPGYSLVVHDLKPQESLRLQALGLGAARCYGCGVFIPHKAITGLE